MKFVKNIFSRMALVLLSVSLQLGVFIGFIYHYVEKFYIVNIICHIIAVFVILLVILRDEPAVFKLPWVITVLLAPIFGICIYLFFGNRFLSRKAMRKMKELQKEIGDYQKTNDEVLKELKAESEAAYGQASYLNTASMLPVYRDEGSTYYRTGEAFWQAVKDELRKAEKYVFMEYFIIQNGVLFSDITEILEERIAAGVKVYLMYDDVGDIGKAPWNFYKKLRAKGIEAVKFNTLNPVASGIHNHRDHRKITVIDGKTGFIGGTNLADEYINAISPFGYWKDNGIRLLGSPVKNMVASFIQLYNMCNYKKLLPSAYFTPDETNKPNLPGFVLPFNDGPEPYYKNYVGKNAFLNIINRAERYLYLTTPYLIVDFHFTEALRNAAMRGVDVRIITPFIPDKKIVNIMTKNSYYNLIAGGVKIYEFKPGFIHSKTIIADDSYALVGSINLDHRSFVHHFESAVWLYKTESLSAIRDDFEKMFANDVIQIDSEKAKLKWHQRMIRNILIVFSGLF